MGPVHPAHPGDRGRDQWPAEDLGRLVRFEPVPPERWRRDPVELSTVDESGVVDPDMAAHISASAVAGRGPTRAADATTPAGLIGPPGSVCRRPVKGGRKRVAPVVDPD